MAETNKSQMMSEAEIIEAINADSLISVSLGAGQPQKNVKMSTLASVAAGLMGFSDLKVKRVSYANPPASVSFGPIYGLVVYKRSWATYEMMIGFVDTSSGYLALISGRSDIWADLSIKNGELISSGSGSYWGGITALLIGVNP